MPLSAARGEEGGRLALGVAPVDDWLGGGLRADALHEVYALSPADGPSALGFALLVARLRRVRGGAPANEGLLWLRDRAAPGLPYGPGLAELGLPPGPVTLLRLADARAVLRAGLEAARELAAATLLIELHGRQPLLDLTATRRFALAAAQSGALVLLLRGAAEPASSAAQSRWAVASAPSRMLEAGAPGPPAFALRLLRQRGGRDGLDIIMEWDRDAASFRLPGPDALAPPQPRALPAVAAGGAGAPGRAEAA